MHICPLCNGLRTIVFYCEQCGEKLKDEGKLTDYFDDYSPYMDADMMKMVDGYAHTRKQHVCVHLFHCDNCDDDVVRFIQE
ncbi:hypothetical protein NP92_03185 [Anoxybacillus gonensis]|uniref:Uncharacterized protein n=1 Tax=Anoxybacillus gonensis TaxID=198467 RepID=A0AAW7TF50_9BACL|nr:MULTISPECIES: hypothetical protein [Anoxybacillus]AKS37477.1 hypothetical protein AFK25_02755 [Anoxybacillus gonensis]KGP61409.1 hypothetical protein NP92_03185 [Anoxybacillus gonensis]MCQ5365579.1 hypothetical protein [Anoxybacillus gonensis]MCX8047104.1 hypothetical protein [Anoxybacillus gonensis]MDO0876714.1 hypothetical protein [Anoxybacillus gonensis]